MPHLVQILLPVYDNAGQRFPTDHYNEVRAKLTKKFGGLTAYTRAPAEGLWDSGSTVKRDDIVAVEIMVESLSAHGGRPTGANSNTCFTRTKSSSELNGTSLSDRIRLASWRTISTLSTDAPNDPPLRGHATAFFGRWSVADPLVGSSAAGRNGISEPTSGTHGFYPVYSAGTGD